MKFSCMLLALTVVLFQWKCASSRYISPSSHISNPRSTNYGNRLRGHTSVKQQRQSIYARRNTVSPHINRHQPMSYRSHSQLITDPSTHQQELRVSKITPNTVLRGYITNKEDEKVTGISSGTRMTRRRGSRVGNTQQLVRRPVSRQRYQSPHKHVHRYSKPMHNIFIRTKSGRKIRISHSLGRTNIVFNTDSISNQNSRSYFKYPRDQRKRLSGSYGALKNQDVSTLTGVDKDANKVGNETISPALPKRVKEHKITAASIADIKVLNETNNPVKVGSPAVEHRANIHSSIKNNTVSSYINTSTLLERTASLVSNNTTDPPTNGNKNNVHNSMSYTHEGQTTPVRTPSVPMELASSTQANPKDNTKSTTGSKQTAVLRGITKQPGITSTNTNDTPKALTGSSTIGDDGTADLPDSITEDIDGIDTPDIPDIAD